VALATNFAHKYRDDFFFRTEINIVGMQVAYAVLILVLVVGALFVLYHDVATSVATAITRTTATGAPLPNKVATAITRALTSTSTSSAAHTILAHELETARTSETIIVASLIIAVAIAFGYLVARFALAPTRNALATQKQFIGNIAHELRTPLSIIKTNTEVRMFDSDLTSRARAIHRSNLEELDRISDIINNLLSLNTLIRPEQIQFENVDVAALVHRVVEKLSYLARGKSIRIKIKIAKERRAWGNTTALEQIVINILKNAIHHTASGEIVISVGPGPQRFLEIAVRDTGSGIKRKDLLRIFEPFYRGDQARTRTGGAGSGLGLAIVSELVKLHRGRVGVKSVFGQGTEVTVLIPLGKNAHEHKTVPDDELPEVSVDFTSAKNTNGQAGS
jgi:signal transduction histidine kinase